MATYYVDATGGNDAWPGTESQPWQTIAKVNGEVFNAGDYILFKRGETWVGTRLLVSWSGIVDNPITFGAYGDGALPIIDGNDAVECIDATGQSYLIFQDLEVSQGLNYGFNLDVADNVKVFDCVGHDCGNDGAAITGSHDIAITRCTFYDQYQRVAGTTTSGISIEDGSYNITITRVICHSTTGTAGQGVTIHNHALATFPHDVIIRNCECYGNTSNGIHVQKDDANVDADRAIWIEGCYCHDNGAHGISISTTTTAYPNGVDVYQCFSIDSGQRALYLEGDDIIVRKSVFCGPAPQLVHAVNCIDAVFYNNTLYTPASVTTVNLMQIEGARTANFIAKNNIFYAASSTVWMIAVQPGTGIVGMDIDYNLYNYTGAGNRWLWLLNGYTWANWKLNSGQDANSPAPADPQFIDAAVDNFRLLRSSPALNVGTEVGMPHLGDVPDIGRWEMGWLSQMAQADLHPVYVGV
jgi:hypothetical protein